MRADFWVLAVDTAPAVLLACTIAITVIAIVITGRRATRVAGLERRERQVPVPVPPVGCRLVLPREDVGLPDDEAPKTGDVRFSSLLFLKYSDARGAISERRITTRFLRRSGDGGLAVFSFCHERQAYRTFLVSRMLEIIDLETGEDLGHPGAFFIGRLAGSPASFVTAAIDHLWAEVRALVFIARSDGAMRAPERGVIAKFVERHAGAQPLDATLLDNEIRRAHCDGAEFDIVLGVLAKKEFLSRSAVTAAAARIVATQESVHPFEKEALETLSRALRVSLDAKTPCSQERKENP